MNANWEKDGFGIERNIYENGALEEFRQTFIQLILMQIDKLGLDPGNLPPDGLERLDYLVAFLNKNDRYALDQASRVLRYCPAGIELSRNPAMLDFVAETLDTPRSMLIVSGPSLFINLPEHKIRLYTWHCEKYWYPKRRNFINLWNPIFRRKRPGNGTMAVIPGSHKKDWSYFSEYFGFDKETEGNRAYNLQYEVPESELGDFKSVEIDANAGDMVYFHSNLVHRSMANASNETSYMFTFRVFDFRRDLTLSSDWTESPYRLSDSGQTGGRFNIRASSIK